MTTVRELVGRAYRLAGITDALDGDDATEPEMQDGLDAINQMMAEWRTRSVPIPHSTFTLDDTLPYREHTMRALAYNLAVELAGEFGVQPSPVIVSIADQSFRSLQNMAHNPPKMQVDPAIHPYYNPNWFPY